MGLQSFVTIRGATGQTKTQTGKTVKSTFPVNLEVFPKFLVNFHMKIGVFDIK